MQFDANTHKAFFDDLIENGFHIFSRRHARDPDFYPNPFPSYPQVRIADLREGDRITVRAFFPTSKVPMPRVDSGHIDLEIEAIDPEAETVFGNILTQLPATFALSKGTSIELNLNEILFVHDR